MAFLFLVTSDKNRTPVPKDFLPRMALFERRPDLATAGSYRLRCQVSSSLLQTVFLPKLYDEFAHVEFTVDNVDQLQELCEELGFSGLDLELQQYRSSTMRMTEERIEELELNFGQIGDEIWEMNSSIRTLETSHELLEKRLRDEIARHEDLLEKIQRQICELVDSKIFERVEELESATTRMTDMMESSSRQFQSLEKKIEDVSHTCEELPLEILGKIEDIVKECPKEGDSAFLCRDVAVLKESLRSQPILTAKTCFCYVNPELDGIISHLTRECGGNVHDEGIVNVIASSFVEGWEPRYAVDFKWTAYESDNENNSWICYDFKNRRVAPTSYSVRSVDGKPGSGSPRTWVFEASDNGTEWTEIDSVSDTDSLNGPWWTQNFPLLNCPVHSFRFVRLRQTGKNCRGTHSLSISALEIFGTISTAEDIEESPKPKERTFVFDSSRQKLFPPPLCHPWFDGVIAYLTSECRGNVHDRGIVNITASSVYNNDACYHPKHVADLNSWSIFESANEEDAWVCYDFKERRVIPVSYSVRSYFGATGDNHPKSWVIEVSNDETENSWTEIDRRNNGNLNCKLRAINFPITSTLSDSFRFFRFRQTGPNHKGRFFLEFCALEIFGTLIEK